MVNVRDYIFISMILCGTTSFIMKEITHIRELLYRKNKDNESNVEVDEECEEITILNKKNTKKKLKVLSDKQIKEKKADLKKRKKKKKKLSKVKRNIKQVRLSKKIIQNVNKKEKMIDICTILDKCNIEQISKYLINQGKNKKLPDITIRE